MSDHALHSQYLNSAVGQASRQAGSVPKLKKLSLSSAFNVFLENHALRRALEHVVGQSVLTTSERSGRLAILQRIFGSVAVLGKSNRRVGYESEDHLGLCEIPVADNTFDWVVSDHPFHEMSDIRPRVQVLRALRRVASLGVIFSVRLQTPLTFRHASNTLSYTELREEIAAAGLEFRAIHYLSWPISPKALVVCAKR